MASDKFVGNLVRWFAKAFHELPAVAYHKTQANAKQVNGKSLLFKINGLQISIRKYELLLYSSHPH
jgi:hypothetical protein